MSNRVLCQTECTQRSNSFRSLTETFNLKVNLAKTEKSNLPFLCNDSRSQTTTDLVVNGNALFQHLKKSKKNRDFFQKMFSHLLI